MAKMYNRVVKQKDMKNRTAFCIKRCKRLSCMLGVIGTAPVCRDLRYCISPHLLQYTPLRTSALVIWQPRSAEVQEQ